MKLSSDYRDLCPGCAWYSGCLKKEDVLPEEGLHCLDYVKEETVREILEENSTDHGEGIRS